MNSSIAIRSQRRAARRICGAAAFLVALLDGLVPATRLRADIALVGAVLPAVATSGCPRERVQASATVTA